MSPAHWCRFNVKQVFQKLKPKRTYTKTFDNTNPVHDSFTRLHGWKWYEMTFFAHWTPSQDTITILCLNLPDIARDGLCEALNTCASKVDLKDPYSITVFLVHQVLRLYDDSVWSIRDHVCEWESNRPREPNYGVLHEVARHAVHVSETLEVASQSIRSIQQQHQDFLDSVSRERDEDSDGDHGAANHRPVAWRKHHSPFRFPLKLVEALTCRAESNKARIQNEMQLNVEGTYNIVSCRLSIPPLRRIARFKFESASKQGKKRRR
ncbi:unnamed protein product [Parascedosporium putredinis]|uniref:Uncharacterized protein n=1 Tax=Parascedosporium putredinis TaxID=1442378 RepID=A0A9P1M7P9_9PEZI|nr:unnamed protein product [Parascedosporium putredinis]CAI7990899.1 unnamed protein product [Parascedosporium putredinis]